MLDRPQSGAVLREPIAGDALRVMEARLARAGWDFAPRPLSLAVNTEPIAHALIEESRSSARADESSRTHFVHAKALASRQRDGTAAARDEGTKGQQPCRTSRRSRTSP